MRSRGLALAAAMAMASATSGLPLVARRERRGEIGVLREPAQEPENRGRRAEKDAIALAKAETKRQRRAAKRQAEVGR